MTVRAFNPLPSTVSRARREPSQTPHPGAPSKIRHNCPQSGKCRIHSGRDHRGPHLNRISRRFALRSFAGLAAGTIGTSALPPFPRDREALAADAGETETYGLSSFGDLAMPPDFKHFGYVNPDAPKGGFLVIQIKSTGGNQNFETFDTLNIFVLKGNGAAGMGATFDALMSGSADEPDAIYGLVAKAVRVSADKLTYRFLLRPEARFHDGSKLTAHDVAFSLKLLKDKGHPTYQVLLEYMDDAAAESDDVAMIRLSPNRPRDAHLWVAGLPIFSQAYWKDKDFEAGTLDPPLGSGAYKVGRFETGRFIEFERVKDYWANDLPVNVGMNNFDRVRWEYFRERQVAFEAFKAGVLTYNEEYTSRYWYQNYDFPAVRDGRVKKEDLHNGAPPATQGWYFNLRRDIFQDPRIREAIGLAFDFEWTNKNIMFSSYKRLSSYFQSTPLMAEGKPSAEELGLLEPFRGKVSDEVFGEPYVPPVSDGSGSDRNLLRRADQLLRAAGCTRDGGVVKLPGGKPLTFEIIDSSPALQPAIEPFQANLARLGIRTSLRFVDSAQYKLRTDDFDFDMVIMALSGELTPGDDLRIVFGSKAASTPGSRNLGGIADPVVDALIDKIARATRREDLIVACRALDRVLRAGRYWVPMYYRDDSWVASWDLYSRPDTQPKYATGAPDTWWFDAEKAKKTKLGG
ncbi:MAG: ABC transporter substrate-binding protein [Methylobacteriaceae bacterium]|nr:ABC transporter substrate-binding protein [Methylobacteriaceae bacterium]